MTSVRKINANRANARRSTGPKTAIARARSAKNALRHGLSLSVRLNAELRDETENLAGQIAGSDCDAQTLELARQIAVAHVDLNRVRQARHQLLSHAMTQPYYGLLRS